MSVGCLRDNIQDLRDLDHLSHSKVDVTDLLRHIQIDSDPLKGLLRVRVHLRPVYKAEGRIFLLAAKIDVLGDRQVRDQGLLLEHHADAVLVGLEDRVH